MTGTERATPPPDAPPGAPPAVDGASGPLPPAREVITSGPRPAGDPRPWPAREDLYARGEAGEVLFASLWRAQLGVTLSVLLPAVMVIGLYPLLAALLPAVARATIGPVPLALVALGGGMYPPLVGLGFWYVRRAERVEARFAELVADR